MIFGSLIPREQNRHLERRHFQIESTNVIGECYLAAEGKNKSFFLNKMEMQH
jgi:hypothetical protein